MRISYNRLVLLVLVGALSGLGLAAQNQSNSNNSHSGPQQRLQSASEILTSMTSPTATARHSRRCDQQCEVHCHRSWHDQGSGRHWRPSRRWRSYLPHPDRLERSGVLPANRRQLRTPDRRSEDRSDHDGDE